MVNKILISIVSFFFISCCIQGERNEFGRLRGKINIDKIFLEMHTTLIDTNIVYTKRYSFFNNKIDNYDTLKFNVVYIKFYKNGKVAIFSPNSKNGLNKKREDFNPKKARMGYLQKRNNQLILKDLGINQCSRYWFKSELVIYKDSIIEYYDNAFNHDKSSGSIWVKDNSIPKEYLDNWKPDW